jgi:hypothetical protein
MLFGESGPGDIGLMTLAKVQEKWVKARSAVRTTARARAQLGL